ncbi:MAG: hypothetical protein IBX72_09800 [Nitrospirae bacterium]|nr:hypothetical protein [Nitrospirota bacterium]
MIWIFEENEQHILEQIKNLFPNLDAENEWNRIKIILQENIPDDWRLTRFSPDFLILDLKTGITLTGEQSRGTGSDTIYKTIRTALDRGSFSRSKIAKHAGSSTAFDIAKRPNIFLGDSTLDEIFEHSSVLARQYEKVSYKNANVNFGSQNSPRYYNVQVKYPIEYFKLQPLTKKGITPGIIVWMKWHVNRGDCSLINGVPPDKYHGEDYWFLSLYK